MEASTKAGSQSKTQNYRTWERLSPLPFGSRVFSVAAWLRAPYFGTVRPIVVAMRPGYSEVTAKKRWRVHNHIGTFHAIALCNLAEMAMGMLAEATVPATHRWIPIGMTTAYTRKATTDLRADRIPPATRLDPPRYVPPPLWHGFAEVLIRLLAGAAIAAIILIIGRSGSGKSSLAKLIIGLYEADAGSLLVDGVDIRQIDVSELRHNIGYVPQDIKLLAGTLRDNLVSGAR